jgi:hypothetical protein
MHHDHGPDDPVDTTGVHGMVLLGESPVYVSHLPMFMVPHNYQVILKVTLEDEVNRKLGDLRAQFGGDMLITVNPEEFAIRDLKPGDDDHAALTEFRADIVNGHFEHGGDTFGADTLIRVDDVTCFQEFDLSPGGSEGTAGDLDYLLFGDADRDLFLAHRVGQRPSFDQLVRVSIDGVHFTEAEIERRGRPSVAIPGRANVHDQRLEPGEVVAAHSSAGSHFLTDVQVEILAEIYFNEDELR